MNSPVSWTEKYEVKPGRWVYVPKEETKLLGRKIIDVVNKKWTAPEYFFHLKKGGHVRALKEHTKNVFFSCLDLTDFFGSMSRTRVTRSLKSHIGYEAARALAKASTVPHLRMNEHSHSIPYGFSQSPILATLCLDKSTLGQCIKQCHESRDVTVTIYMDDIVISSSDSVYLATWITLFKEAALKSKLVLNDSKESPIATSVEVFNIELSHKHLKVTEERFNLFYKAYNESDSLQQRNGIGGYVWTVNPAQAKMLDQ
ncbi:reverse transcriptase domain-containing protein [Photobacterium sp.]|uniref:reverse transcriptase domain-containing protein n=1 Tax=Photobacterium sp. TaxID=660 RepID=UPI00299E357F|nr:reverse transcriptase domain-containing protein [Photobacterium sp.]MDX1303430.1 reverse transcriptase domain-containing protein [Photobacterium sp.]